MLAEQVAEMKGATILEQFELDGFDLSIMCDNHDEQRFLYFREFAVGGSCTLVSRFWADSDSLYTAIAYFLSREHEQMLEDLDGLRAVEAYDGQVILSYLDGSDRLVV